MADALTLHFRKTFPKGALIDADLEVKLDPPITSLSCLDRRALVKRRFCALSLDWNAPQTLLFTFAVRPGWTTKTECLFRRSNVESDFSPRITRFSRI